MTKILNDSIEVKNFSRAYPIVNKYIIENGDFLSSRYGDTREVIDFKTTVTNPLYRCVGNNERDINIFFLIAEALWIWRGMKDVATLKKFNSKMAEFSDDGEFFHAPYGFRIRHHGVSSFDKLPSIATEENKHHLQQQLEGLDQMVVALNMLNDSPETRRAVIQIWNADLDLGTNSKDLPCNDLMMIKAREGRLRVTIANRSNDIHWGLTTNIFQFSFISEIMARILELDLGTQTHNSQSLHAYIENPLTFNMYDAIQITDGKFEDLYDFAIPSPMQFDFKSESIEGRVKEIDAAIDIIFNLINNNEGMSNSQRTELELFCPMFLLYFDLMNIYLDYKYDSQRTEADKVKSLKKVISLSENYPKYDIIALAQNFFFSKIKDQITIKPLVAKLISPKKL